MTIQSLQCKGSILLIIKRDKAKATAKHGAAVCSSFGNDNVANDTKLTTVLFKFKFRNIVGKIEDGNLCLGVRERAAAVAAHGRGGSRCGSCRVLAGYGRRHGDDSGYVCLYVLLIDKGDFVSLVICMLLCTPRHVSTVSSIG